MSHDINSDTNSEILFSPNYLSLLEVIFLAEELTRRIMHEACSVVL